MKQENKTKDTDRVTIISAVKTYLGFFVFTVLVVETVLGGLALTAVGQNQLVAIYAMIALILLLIGVVSFFAYYKPRVLLTGFTHSDDRVMAADKFVQLISGYWWEIVSPISLSAISFVEMRPDPASGTVKMKGRAFGKDGNHVANWESVAACINFAEHKIFYYWKGWHPSTPNEPYEGFGEISFALSDSKTKTIDSGDGFFSDTNLTDMKATTRKSIQCRRCLESEIAIMKANNKQSIIELTRRILE